MTETKIDQVNYAPILAVVFGAFCWLSLYALYADFAQRGFELLHRPGFMSGVEGIVLLGLYALGLVLLLGCGLAAVGALLKATFCGSGPGQTKVDGPL